MDLCPARRPSPPDSAVARSTPSDALGIGGPVCSSPRRTGSPTHHHWPEIVTDRHEVIEARTADGETCTLIVLRGRDGRFGLYFHGALRSSAMLPLSVYAKLISALTRLAG